MKQIYFLFLGLAVTIFSSSAFASEIYKVSQVGSGTSLNLRAWPSPKSRVKVAIPHNASWIIKRGVSKKVGNSEWQKVLWNREEGWVNGKFISIDPLATRLINERKQCLSDPKVKNKTCCGYPKSERKRPFKHIDILTVKGIPAGKTLPLRSQPGRWKGKVMVAIPHNATWIARLGKKTKLPNGEVWEYVRWNGQKGWINTANTFFDKAITQQGDQKRKMCSLK